MTGLVDRSLGGKREGERRKGHDRGKGVGVKVREEKAGGVKGGGEGRRRGGGGSRRGVKVGGYGATREGNMFVYIM